MPTKELYKMYVEIFQMNDVDRLYSQKSCVTFLLTLISSLLFANAVIRQYKALGNNIRIINDDIMLRPADFINMKQILAKDIVLVSCIFFYIFILNKIHKTIIPISTKARFRKRYQLLYNIRYA